jgi:ABC-2 type transport system permease protein
MTAIIDTGRDTWLVFTRALGQTLRNPVWVVVTLAQPLFYLALFAPLLKPLAGAQGFGSASAYNWFVPGLLVQLGLFGSAFVGFSLISEVRAGVIERLQVTPISRTSLLLGRSGRDVVALVFQAAVLMTLARVVGDLDVSPAGMASMMGLLALLALALSAFSYTLALVLGSEDALAPLLNAVSVPLLLLSGILLPLSFGPAWLQRLADLNPLHHTVDAARALLAGSGFDATAVRGLAVTAAMAAVATAVGVRRFRHAAT